MQLDKITAKQFRRSTIAEINDTTIDGNKDEIALRMNTDHDYYILQMTHEEAQALHRKIGRLLERIG